MQRKGGKTQAERDFAVLMEIPSFLLMVLDKVTAVCCSTVWQVFTPHLAH